MTIQPENETDAYYLDKAVQWTIDREKRFMNSHCPKCGCGGGWTTGDVRECAGCKNVFETKNPR